MIQLLRNLFASLNLDKKGQDLTEYALLVALIAIIVVLAVLFSGEADDAVMRLLDATVSSWIN